MLAPEKRSDDTFNRMADVWLGDMELAARVRFDLETLARQNKLDFTGKVAYAEALLILGERDEAIRQINAAYGVRDHTEIAAFDRLMHLHRDVAMRARAIELCRELIGIPGVAAMETIFQNCRMLALWTGDLGLLGEMTDRETRSGLPSLTCEALSLLNGLGILDHVAEHQRIVADIVRDSQMHCQVYAVFDDDGQASLFQEIYIDGTKATRRGIRDDIRAAIARYSASVKIGALDLEQAIITLVSEAPRHGKDRLMAA